MYIVESNGQEIKTALLFALYLANALSQIADLQKIETIANRPKWTEMTFLWVHNFLDIRPSNTQRGN